AGVADGEGVRGAALGAAAGAGGGDGRERARLGQGDRVAGEDAAAEGGGGRADAGQEPIRADVDGAGEAGDRVVVLILGGDLDAERVAGRVDADVVPCFPLRRSPDLAGVADGEGVRGAALGAAAGAGGGDGRERARLGQGDRVAGEDAA